MKTPFGLSFAFAAVASVFVCATQSAQATTYTYGSDGTTNWSTATWTPTGPPVSSLDTVLSFSNVNARNTTNNLGAFQLNRLTMTNSSSATNAQALSIAGNTLNFVKNSSNVLPTLMLSRTNSANAGQTPSITISAPITVTDALTITTSVASGTVSITGAITNNAGMTFDGTSTVGITLGTGVTSGAGGITIAGSYNVNMTGNNTYDGLTDVQSGKLTLNRSGGTIKNTSAVQVSGGELAVAQSDTVGAVTLSSGTISGAGTLTGSSYSLTNTGSVSAILGGSGVALTKSGAGTAILSAANTYTGLTTVSVGALNIGSAGSLNSGNALTVDASGTADFANAGQTLGAVSNANTATNALNFSAATGTVTLASLSGAGNTRFGSNGTVTGGISTGTVTSVGALTANIAGGTVMAGGLLTGTISSGTVGAGSLSSTSVTGGSNTITGAADITTLNGGITTVGGVATIGTLTSGTANLNGATSAITTLNGGTVNLGSSTLTVSNGTTSGAITGASGALTVTGALALNGSNTYGGVTSISTGGDLRVNGTNSGSGAVNVASGANLGGSGSVIAGINVSGVLAPGNSIESFGGGALSFITGSTYAYELQTNLFAGTPNLAGDLLYSSGTLSIASGTILTLTDLATSTALASGSKLTLISSAGAWNNGQFSYDAGAGLATLVDDSTFTLNANMWKIDYNDTTAGSNFNGDTTGATNFVTLTVIPEPNVPALLGGLGVLALLRRRRA